MIYELVEFGGSQLINMPEKDNVVTATCSNINTTVESKTDG